MKANDLRIGNWVRLPHGFVQVEEIYKSRGVKMTDGCGGNFASIESILLTSEILQNAGFKYNKIDGVTSLEDETKEGDTEYWEKGNLTIVSWDGGELTLSNSFSFNLRIILKTVHQLQNLYFALTGEELEINLNP